MKNISTKMVLITGFLICMFISPQIVSADTVYCTSLKSNNLRLGSRDKEVYILQKFLQDQKYLTSAPTGYYGTQTKLAVSRFQANNSLGAIGSVGPLTRAKIISMSCAAPAASLPVVDNQIGIFDTDLQIGGTGVNVILLQNDLKKNGFFVEDVKGIFGTSTKAAVVFLQMMHKIVPADGIVDKTTRDTLFVALGLKTGPVTPKIAKSTADLEIISATIDGINGWDTAAKREATVRVTVRNSSTENLLIPIGTEFELYKNGQLLPEGKIFTEYTLELLPNQNFIIEKNIITTKYIMNTMILGNSFTLTVKGDVSNKILEKDKNNNSFVTSVNSLVPSDITTDPSLVGGARPNVQITSVVIKPQSFTSVVGSSDGKLLSLQATVSLTNTSSAEFQGNMTSRNNMFSAYLGTVSPQNKISVENKSELLSTNFRVGGMSTKELTFGLYKVLPNNYKKDVYPIIVYIDENQLLPGIDPSNSNKINMMYVSE